MPSVVMPIGMATDLIKRACNPREVGPSVQCLSNIIRHAGEKIRRNAQTKFKIAKSETADSRDDAKAVIKACLDPEVKYKSKDAVVFMADNVNFKVDGGIQAGTVNSKTLSAHRMPDADDVDRYYGENALSQEPSNDWMQRLTNITNLEDCNLDEVVSDVFLARTEDYDSLNELLLIHVKAVLKSYKTLCDTDFVAMDQSKKYVLEEGFPKLERIFDEADLEKLDVPATAAARRREQAAVHATEEDDASTVSHKTLFTKNHVKPNIVCDLNFSQSTTITEFF